jgi:hypothetical protein
MDFGIAFPLLVLRGRYRENWIPAEAGSRSKGRRFSQEHMCKLDSTSRSVFGITKHLRDNYFGYFGIQLIGDLWVK